MNIKSILNVIFPSLPTTKDFAEKRLKAAQKELHVLDLQRFDLFVAIEHEKHHRAELLERINRLTQHIEHGNPV